MAQALVLRVRSCCTITTPLLSRMVLVAVPLSVPPQAEATQTVSSATAQERVGDEAT